MDLVSLLTSTTSKGNPNAWDISKAVYSNVSFSVAAQETNPYGISFKTDGTKMYIAGDTGNDINEYSLSTAWDITTASYVQNYSVNTHTPFPSNIYFKPDGTKLYIANFDQVSSTYSRVNEYTLSTAWDISSTSYTRNFSVSAKETQAYGVFFKDDGTKMYVVGSSSDSVHEYSLATAWNISTATFSQSKSVSAQDTAPWGVFFKTDGTKMYVLGQTGNDINEYALSSAWDISTATYVTTFSVGAQETSPAGFYWKDDGLQFWMVGLAQDTVFSYTIT